MRKPNKHSAARERYAIGMLSGTSVDGIDVALVAFSASGNEVRLLEFFTDPFPDTIREMILAYSHGEPFTAEQHTRLHWALGHVFAEAAAKMIARASLAKREIAFIASHGQTVQHLPADRRIDGYSSRGTLQLGEAAVIAEKTGITTVYDFRAGDMAAGGEGAPLISYFDYLFFASPGEHRILLNIGGIANLTVLPAGCGEEHVQASDTGPGNMLIDAVCRYFFKQTYDKDGKIAAEGVVDRALLDDLLQHPYFTQSFPKSTGREQFGQNYVDSVIRQAKARDVSARDLVATLTELTVQTVAAAVRDRLAGLEPDKPARLIISGGGAQNPTLMHSLQEALQEIPCETTEAHGFSPDAKEAVCFAVLGRQVLQGKTATIPSATGAGHPALTGKVCFVATE